MEYYHDVAAPQARELLPAAFAVTRNGSGRILLVRRADDGYWELPGGRVEIGESASAAAIREVAEETGVRIKITGLAGVYSDPGHVLAYPRAEGVYQQVAVCFHAFSPARDAQPDHEETTAAGWFDPEQATQLIMHPAMRRDNRIPLLTCCYDVRTRLHELRPHKERQNPTNYTGRSREKKVECADVFMIGAHQPACCESRIGPVVRIKSVRAVCIAHASLQTE